MIRPCCAENSPNLSIFIFFRYDANYFAIFPMRVIIIDFSEYVNYPLLSLRALSPFSAFCPLPKNTAKNRAGISARFFASLVSEQNAPGRAQLYARRQNTRKAILGGFRIVNRR